MLFCECEEAFDFFPDVGVEGVVGAELDDVVWVDAWRDESRQASWRLLVEHVLCVVVFV